MIISVEKDNIDSTTKRIIFSLSQRLKCSLEEYFISGRSDIEKTFNTIIFKIIQNNYIDIKEINSESANSFWQIMNKIAIIFTIATTVICLPSQLSNIFSEQTVTAISDINEPKIDNVISSNRQQPMIELKDQKKEYLGSGNL